MNGVSLSPLGRVDLNDLIGMCPERGDGVPYPFWRTQRTPYRGEIAERLVPIDRRFTEASERVAQWVRSYAQADIWVECRVNSFSGDVDDLRLLAHQVGEAGFLGTQSSGSDTADLFGLSSVDLSGAIAASAGLWRPGRRTEISIPGFLDNFMDRLVTPTNEDAETDDDDFYAAFTVLDRPARSVTTRVHDDELTLLGTAQSRFQQRTVCDVDWNRPAVAWVRVRDDGDYIYNQDYTRAFPLTFPILRERIELLIAADIAQVRHGRAIGRSDSAG